jgi:large subunit ribosomal protein L29
MRIHAREIDASTMDALRAKDVAQLKQDLKTLREHDLDLRLQKAYAQLENTARPGANRQNIARVLTMLRQKQIQHFLLGDPDVRARVESGKIALSAGKSDPKKPITLEDLAGTDARSMTLAMRLWARLRRDPDFFYRTRHIPNV